MNDRDQIVQAIHDAMHGLSVIEGLLTDALDAMWRLEREEDRGVSEYIVQYVINIASDLPQEKATSIAEDFIRAAHAIGIPLASVHVAQLTPEQHEAQLNDALDSGAVAVDVNAWRRPTRFGPN